MWLLNAAPRQPTAPWSPLHIRSLPSLPMLQRPQAHNGTLACTTAAHSCSSSMCLRYDIQIQATVCPSTTHRFPFSCRWRYWYHACEELGTRINEEPDLSQWLAYILPRNLESINHACPFLHKLGLLLLLRQSVTQVKPWTLKKEFERLNSKPPRNHTCRSEELHYIKVPSEPHRSKLCLVRPLSIVVLLSAFVESSNSSH
jgi:hypothetical protein